MQTDWAEYPATILFLEPEAYYEARMQSNWNRIPLNRPYRMPDGSSLTVLSRGEWNLHDGPDFRSAKIKLGDKILRGDVELHRKTTDWLRHKHSDNPAYANVVLHVVDMDDTTDELRFRLPRIPVFRLAHEEKFARVMPPSARSCTGGCAAFFARLDAGRLRAFAVDAGMERMQMKSEVMLEEMIRSGIEQSFLCKLFDFAGVPGNRAQFTQLAARVLAYPREHRAQGFESILWGESGLLPDPAARPLPPDAEVLVKRLWNEWWTLRGDSKSPLEWKRSSRPLNSIERKIAFLAAFVAEFTESPLPRLSRMVRFNSGPDILEKLRLHHAFWDRHTGFYAPELRHAAALGGSSLGLELLVNVIIPAVRAYALLARDMVLLECTSALYRDLPGTENNRIIRLMEERCFPGRLLLLDSAAARQGLLHLYREHCEKNSFDCGICTLYHSI